MSQTKSTRNLINCSMLLTVSALVMSQPAMAANEMDIIDRIRPVGQVKISAEKDIRLAESLPKTEAAVSPVGEVKDSALKTVDQAAEATKEVVKEVAKVADVAVAAVAEVVDKVADAASKAVDEVVDKVADAVAGTDINGLGQKVYNKVCFACHGTGIPGFPKVGDKEVWAPRIAQGRDVLIEHAINGTDGKPAMPPRAGKKKDELSDEEIAAAVDYMVSQSQ